MSLDLSLRYPVRWLYGSWFSQLLCAGDGTLLTRAARRTFFFLCDWCVCSLITISLKHILLLQESLDICLNYVQLNVMDEGASSASR